jgi:hypothetical protein
MNWKRFPSLLCILSGAFFPSLTFAQDPKVIDKKELEDQSSNGPRGTVKRAGGWTIEPEIRALSKSMNTFAPLVKTLTRGSKDLARAYQQFSKNPKNELLAARVEKKLARYAAGLLKEFQNMTGEQDVLLSNMRVLNHRMQQMTSSLKIKSQSHEGQLKNYRKTAVNTKKELIKIAQQIKSADPGKKAQIQALKRSFGQKFRNYRIQQRYLRGYTNRLGGYSKLSQYVGRLGEVFQNLEGQFQVLVENLENERKYLRESMEMQAEGINMKKFMRANVAGSETALAKITANLDALYKRVEAFTQVHDRINSSLDNFGEGRDQWSDLMGRLNKLGLQAGDDASLEKLIDSFSKRNVNAASERSDDLLLKDE